MEVLVVGIAALIGGFVLGSKLNAKAVVPVLSEVLNVQAIDRANYLQTLRRELANILIWRDPQRYLQLYRQLLSEVTSIGSWRTEEVHRRLAKLSKKYSNYSDFDAIATREYVLYPDGVSWNDDAELEGNYRDIVTFVALSVIGDPTWKEAASRGFVHKLNDNELEHLSTYVQRIEDTKMHLRIDQAVEAYYSRRDELTGLLDNDFYTVQPLQSVGENRYGINLKRTGEFAIYSFFVFDDGRISYSYYRSNSNFEQELQLDVLHSILEEAKGQP